VIRKGATDEELAAAVADQWRVRKDRYSELRAQATPDLERIEMSYIGG
jgi:cyclic pyranopterin phosphate synthase